MKQAEQRQQLSEFLRTRRAKIKPDEVGLPNSARRRVAGLRREEVAQLAGVSVDWYTWLEQGRDIRTSEQVLQSIAHALRLDPAETNHLFRLAADSLPSASESQISPMLQFLLDSQGPIPAFIMDIRWDILAWNRAACLLHEDLARLPPDERNVIWITFTGLHFRQVMPEWERHARRAVAQFRADYDLAPGDARFRSLVSHLMEVSPEFGAWWSSHDVQERTNVNKALQHPAVGELALEQITLQVAGSPGLRLVMLVPLPGTPTLARLQELLECAEAKIEAN
jgi:transcriptional regulator with XRE-family HTH domain